MNLREAIIAVVGAGRMGSAIIKGLVSAGARVIATGRRRETLERARSLGAEAMSSNAEAVRRADMVIIAVKPYNYPDVAEEIAPHIAGKVVASIMAGVPLKLLDASLPGAENYRVMPNIGALVGCSATAIALRETGRERGERWRLVEEAFKQIGDVVWIPETLLDAWTALAGSGPGILAELLDAVMLAGTALGIPRSNILKALAMQLEALSKLLTQGLHPAELRDMVATPAGTTIAGIHSLSNHPVRGALMNAFTEALRRSKELSREVEEELRRRLNLSL